MSGGGTCGLGKGVVSPGGINLPWVKKGIGGPCEGEIIDPQKIKRVHRGCRKAKNTSGNLQGGRPSLGGGKLGEKQWSMENKKKRS